MKNSKLKQTMQHIAVRTQFIPFVWFYRALYGLAIRLCVRRFRRIQGVHSVYLRRGLATGNVLYGLSDIDLLVIIDGDLGSRLAARVRYEYQRLCMRIPMLSKDELALYNPELFRNLWEYSLFYRNRFEEGRQGWVRLYGEDIFTHLPAPLEKHFHMAAQELMPAWNYLAEELLPNDERPLYLRRYVAYKAIAEAARAAVVLEEKKAEMPRDEAIVVAGEKYIGIIEKLSVVKNWRSNLLSKDPLPIDMSLELWLFLAHKATEATPPEMGPRLKFRIPACTMETLTLTMDNGAIDKIQKACAMLKEIGRAVLVPRFSFTPLASIGLDPSTFAGATIDAFDLVLIGERLPPARKLRDFIIRLNRINREVNPFFCNAHLAVSLRPIEGEPVLSPNSAPEFFQCLSSTTDLTKGLEMGGPVVFERSFLQENTLERRAQTILSLFRRAEVFRLSLRSFFTLFWEAGRAALIADQPSDEVIDIPVSSIQLVERLAAFTPAEASLLKEIHGEYVKELHGKRSEGSLYTTTAALYARKLEELIFSSDGRNVKLPERTKAELTISVLIVTRNRARLLRRALRSLVEQVRQPDQVVVVDNASTDETSSVAHSFKDSLNLKLVFEQKIGIPYAKNTGIEHCTEDIVAIMDDDCIAVTTWLAELEIPFLKDPHVGAVGGSVLPLEGQKQLVARFYDKYMNPN